MYFSSERALRIEMLSVGQAEEETRRQSAVMKSVFGCEGLMVERAEVMKEGEESMPIIVWQWGASLAVRVPSPQPLWSGLVVDGCTGW